MGENGQDGVKKYIDEGGFILGQTAWEDGVPWLRPNATEYIKGHLPKDAIVYEWGMGASTVWFLRMGCKLYTNENDAKWFLDVSQRILDIKTGWSYSTKYIDLEEYADSILDFPNNYFDLILIDGRNRCRCLANALEKVKIGGMLCLDNSERSEYSKAVALMDTWEGYEWGDEGWMTAVWHRLPHSITSRVIFPNEDA